MPSRIFLIHVVSACFLACLMFQFSSQRGVYPGHASAACRTGLSWPTTPLPCSASHQALATSSYGLARTDTVAPCPSIDSALPSRQAATACSSATSVPPTPVVMCAPWSTTTSPTSGCGPAAPTLTLESNVRTILQYQYKMYHNYYDIRTILACIFLSVTSQKALHGMILQTIVYHS